MPLLGDLSEYKKYQLFEAHGIASATGVRLQPAIKKSNISRDVQFYMARRNILITYLLVPFTGKGKFSENDALNPELVGIVCGAMATVSSYGIFLLDFPNN